MLHLIDVSLLYPLPKSSCHWLVRHRRHRNLHLPMTPLCTYAPHKMLSATHYHPLLVLLLIYPHL